VNHLEGEKKKKMFFSIKIPTIKGRKNSSKTPRNENFYERTNLMWELRWIFSICDNATILLMLPYISFLNVINEMIYEFNFINLYM
jgi:polyphosphate kinase